MENKDTLGGLKNQIQVSAAEHKRKQSVNGFFHGAANLGVILALIAVSLVPVGQQWQDMVVKGLHCLVALMFIVDRLSGSKRSGSFYWVVNVILILTLIMVILTPVNQQWQSIAAKSLLCLVMMIFILDRFYDFADRQRYHREMRHCYVILWAKIDHYLNMPYDLDSAEKGKSSEEKGARYEEIFKEYSALALRESKKTGVGEGSAGA